MTWRKEMAPQWRRQHRDSVDATFAAHLITEFGDRPVASTTGLARSTVQRIVYALESEHLLQAGVGGVRPGWGLRHLAEWAGPDVLREIRPQLYRLFEATRETVDVSTLWEGEVLFLDRFLSNQ